MKTFNPLIQISRRVFSSSFTSYDPKRITFMPLRRLFPMLIMFLTVLSCSAIKYQIKYLNTPSIKIDKRQHKVGDWFSDNSKIYWENTKQAMRVLSENNRVYTISASKFNKKVTTLGEFISGTKTGGNRGGFHTLHNDLEAIFQNEYEILDELQIDLSDVEDLPADITFTISSTDDSIKPLSLKPENGILTIARESLDQVDTQEDKISLTIKFTRSDGKASLITDQFELLLLPL